MNITKNVPELRFKEFSGEWEEDEIKNICLVCRGASPRPINNSKWFDKFSKIGWVRISDVSKSKKYLLKTEQYLSKEGINKSRFVKKNQLIMSICATIGKPIITGFDVCIHDGFVHFQDIKINIEFLYYLLEKKDKYWFKYGQIGSQINLNTDIINKEIINYPYSLEQQKIASFLSAIDKKIELTDKKIEYLERYKKGLMQKLLTGKVRFQRFNDEWQETILKKLTEFQKGTSITKHFTNNGNIPVIAGGMKPAYFHNEFNRNEPIITVSSSGASAGYVNFFEIPIFASDCFTIKGKEKILNTKFLFFILKNIQDKIYLLQHGGAQPHIYPKDLFNFKFYYPSLAEQQKIASFLTLIDKKIELNKNKLENLKSYKKGLLQKMFI